ncbi:MAG: UvrD-helicase domain-containing protein [Gemmatimonadaceae bacterium]|nr:UvrD-helicase domain-containing protein [Gemmatimonadaceae bacterium]
MSEFQIVDAPPGTGKTFTACRRIVWLVEQGVHAHQIWMISFTRAAIAELRIRIRQLSKDGHAVDGLVASTLDSRAWHLVNGFTTRGGRALVGGHEHTIDEAIALLQNPPDELAEWLASIRHLVVDEAQDLVGSRARLLHAILAALPQGCGVTIFGDRAQAIYGFAEDSHRDTADPFIRQCMTRYFGRVVARGLTRVFRTDNDGLQRLFDDTRSELLDRLEVGGEIAYIWLRDLLLTGFPADDFEDPDRFDLQLHRRRFAALDEAMWALAQGEPGRLRLSGYPRAITPWLGMVFGECVESVLYRADFERLIADASAKWQGSCWPQLDEAWSVLRLLAPLPGGALSLHQLRLVLASGNVPDLLLLPEFGFNGSIYSTIHASKGREAGQVDVELPPNFENGETNWEEEARVLFVAATRASRDLVVKEGKRLYIARASDGRDVRRVNGGSRRCQIEVGLEGDLDLPSVISGSRADVAASQRVLALAHDRTTRLRARLPGRSDGDWSRYRLFEEERSHEPIDSRHLGKLSSRFYWMLKDTGTRFWPDKRNFPPPYIQHIHSLGARTVVFAPDDPSYVDAAEPFASSGFFLAPMVIGLPTIPFFT